MELKDKLKSKFIVIEGMDGTGKTTIAKELTERLQNEEINAIYTFEPTQGEYGSIVRNHFFRDTLSKQDELKYFNLDRQQHVDRFIKPHLEEGSTIICDRYYHSTIVYQEIEKEQLDITLEPDFVFILTCSVDTALSRMRNKEKDKYENKGKLEVYKERYETTIYEKSYKYINVEDKSIDEILKEIIEILSM